MRNIKKYPVVKQNDFKDCGVCCLQMIIQYYNGYVGLEKLRELTKTNKNGTTAYHLVECLKKIGFNAKGIKVSLGKLSDITFPCIAHVTINKSFNHFVVIYNIDSDKKELIIADPAMGLRTIKFDDFSEIFNNVLITAFPVKIVPIMYKEESFVKFIKRILIQNKNHFVLIFLISLLITFLSVVGSLYLKILIDSISRSNSYLVFIFLFFFIIKILEVIINFIRNKLIINLNQKISFDLTTETFTNIISLPYNYYRNRTTGEIISRINDLNTVKDVVSKLIVTIFIDMILTMVSACLLIKINKLLFICSLGVLCTYILLNFLFKKKVFIAVDELQRESANTNSYMVEAITGFETVKGLNAENLFDSNFKKMYDNYQTAMLKFDNLNNFKSTLIDLINQISSFVIIFVSILFVKRNYMTLGEALMFQVILNCFINPIKLILDMDVTLKQTINAYKRIVSITPLIIKKQKKSLVNLNTISFNNVYYNSDDDKSILKGISLDFNIGDKVMIIGKSGVGKSTILKLIKGYYTATSGEITIDGNKIDLCSKTNIIYISQNEYLFTDSIYNNITLKTTINENKVKRACDICRVNEIVQDNNLSYYMLLEENGFNISGGEKQRIILARSIIKKFDIILIDEGFSELDTNLERLIIKDLFKTFKNKIFIVVSHRLDNADLFDKLIEIKDGQVKNLVERNN